jgi:hypothetical protein
MNYNGDAYICYSKEGNRMNGRGGQGTRNSTFNHHPYSGGGAIYI